MSESQNSPPPQLGTNSSSVAIAILVPFFALIFTGFGFYLYKQRFVSDLLLSSLRLVSARPPPPLPPLPPPPLNRFLPLCHPLRRTTPKTQYTGCSVHENNNGQAAFENPMYNTNTKAVEGKAVRFDPNLNTVCTMV